MSSVLRFVFFFVVSCGFALSGCVTAAPPDDGRMVLLGDPPNFDETKSFQQLTQATAGTKAYERARIEYLLERMNTSLYAFVRNGIPYSGRRGAVHLRWKYLRHPRNAPTAEAFADHIAASSKITGEEYLMQIGPNETRHLKKIMHDELKLLAQGLAQYKIRTKASDDPAPALQQEYQGGPSLVVATNTQGVKENTPKVETLTHSKQLA